MNITLKLADETCRMANDLAIDENKSLSGWLAALIEAEVARRAPRAPQAKTLAEALTLAGAPEWFYEKEFPMEDRKAVPERDFHFDRDRE